MMSREEWEDEEAQDLIEIVRRRRKALEDFAAALPALREAAPEEARAQIKPLADKLNEFLRNFHMNNLDEMERLRLEIQKLAPPH